MMAYYETVYMARQDVSAEQVDALTDTFEEVIKEGGGSISKRESWGLKSLAYRVKKSRKAHYMLMNIEAPASAVHEMERQMRLNEDVLRYMTLRVNELDDEPSIQAQNKSNQPYDDEKGGEFRARTGEAHEKTPSNEDAEEEDSKDTSSEKDANGETSDIGQGEKE